MRSIFKSFTDQVRSMPREMALLLIAAIIANTASSAYYPFLPLYLETLGASVEQVGLFFTIQTIMSILFRFLGGWISDNLGRLQSIAISGVLGALALVGFALAPTWELAIIGALFGSMGGSLHAPSFQAYTAENAPKDRTASTFGMISTLFQICQVIGPALGGFLVESFSYKVLLWTTAAIFGVAAIMRVWLARESRFVFKVLTASTLRRDLRAMVVLLLGGGLAMWLFVVDGLHDAGFQVIFPFIPKYITEVGGLSEGVYGTLRSELSLISMSLAWLGGRLADRFGDRWGVALGGLLQVVALAVMVFIPNLAGFVLGFGIFGMGMAFIGPAIPSLMSKAVPKGSLGMMYGLLYSALGVVAVPAPYIGGWLYDNLGPRIPILTAMVVILLSVPMAVWKLRAEKDKLKGRAG